MRNTRMTGASVGLLVIVPILFASCGGSFKLGNFTFGNQRTPPTIVTVSNTDPAPNPKASQNWSGYYITGTRGRVTGVTATWQIPQVVGPEGSDSSTWVGIGGIQSDSLIQAGTDQLIHDGNPQYYPWIEMLPAAPQPVKGLDLLPGDTITVTITWRGGNQWSITLNDHDANQSTTQTVQYASCLCSAEWIEEAPSLNGKESALADFTSVTFTKCTTTYDGRQYAPADLRAKPIAMITPRGRQMAVPQVMQGDTFSVVDVAGN